MDTQNINKISFNIDVALDSSEFYDYHLNQNYNDYYTDILDLTKEIAYSSLVFDSNCITGSTFDSTKPLKLELNVPYTGGTCNYTPIRRTEKGWTIDFVFNRNGLDWISGGTFYFLGVLNSTNPYDYADNSLSFNFSAIGTLDYNVYRYSGYCDTVSGYTESFYTDNQGSGPLCSLGTSNDFEITITFDRYLYYSGCQIDNQGGYNDLITGYTVENPLQAISGATEIITMQPILNEKWEKEQDKRYGTLRFYLNGNPIFKKENWEEVIPSDRVSGETTYQIFGGGTDTGSLIHSTSTNFEVKRVQFYNEPLSPLNVKHHYLTTIKPNYNIVECITGSTQTITGILPI